MQEIHRVTRTLTNEHVNKHPIQDVVLVHNLDQSQPWGFARVRPDEEVLLHDVEMAFTIEELDAFMQSIKQHQAKEQEPKLKPPATRSQLLPG